MLSGPKNTRFFFQSIRMHTILTMYIDSNTYAHQELEDHAQLPEHNNSKSANKAQSPPSTIALHTNSYFLFSYNQISGKK